MEVTVRYERDMTFTSRGPSGHDVPLDAAPEAGGTDSGARPMEMLLRVLGGCTGMNVVSILRKMRVDYDSFEMHISGERSEEHPKRFTAIHVEYRFAGSDVEEKRAQIERAVQLSHDRYCSVAASLNPEIPVTYRIALNEGGGE